MGKGLLATKVNWCPVSWNQAIWRGTRIVASHAYASLASSHLQLVKPLCMLFWTVQIFLEEIARNFGSSSKKRQWESRGFPYWVRVNSWSCLSQTSLYGERCIWEIQEVGEVLVERMGFWLISRSHSACFRIHKKLRNSFVQFLNFFLTLWEFDIIAPIKMSLFVIKMLYKAMYMQGYLFYKKKMSGSNLLPSSFLLKRKYWQSKGA